MSSTKIPSPARSQGIRSTPRQRRFRNTRSVGSPAQSTTSVKLSSIVQENKDSFIISPLPNRRSVLSDNTEIEIPKRGSWWKRLDESSKDVMEFIENREQGKTANIEEFIDAEILSQEKKNYTIDLPDSSDGESIRSIVLPQRKLFTQKDQSQKVYKNIIDKRENLESLQKSKVNYDNSIHVGKKDFFNKGGERSKPAFPAALLNVSLDKTELNKKDKDISKHGQVRNLFSNRAGTKRKNMFSKFILSDSEDEICDIQTKIFGFAKTSDQQQARASPSSRFRQTSPTSDVTDVELDDWKLLPSSTMVDNQFGDLENTPVKKARLSKTMPTLDETINSKSDKTILYRKNNEKSLENKPMEDVSQNRMIAENNVQSNISKTRYLSDEIVKVVESSSKVSESPQNALSPKDLPVVHHDLRKSKSHENVNDGTNICQNISKNDKDNIQKNKEFVTSQGNLEQIGDIEMEKSLSENNEENLRGDDENEGSEENHEDSGDKEMSLDNSENDDYDQEDDNNDEDLQEDEDQEDEVECVPEEENEEEMDDIEIEQNISGNIAMDLQKNEEYKADEGNQEELSKNEIGQNKSKNNTRIRDEELYEMEIVQNVSNKNKDNLQNENEYVNYEEIDEYQSEEKKHDDHKNKEQSNERQMNIFVDKEKTVRESKLINDENNKDVVDNQEQRKDDTDQMKNEQKRSISSKDLNKSHIKDKDVSRGENNKGVPVNQDQHKSYKEDINNQIRANESNGLNRSERNDKNKSGDNQDSERNKNSTAHDKTERSIQNRSKINATHDTTGRNRQRVELEVKSPEEVRNYIANDLEYISPTGRETSSRKTRSVIKLNQVRPSLAPLRESTGISDGTYNSSVERSGWDSHRTTRKTLRQTFGKDFTPRKSLRALVMEKSAKRQTYGFDMTTKIPQACSTRLPENMHDITNDDINVQQHESEIQVEMSGKVPLIETEKDANNKEEAISQNSSRKDALKKKPTADSDNILTGDKNNLKGKNDVHEISKEREEYQNTQEDKMNGEEEKNSKKMKENKSIQAIQDSQNTEVEASNEEMQDSPDAEFEADDEEMQNSQDADFEGSDDEIQDSNDIGQNAESEEAEENIETESRQEVDGKEESDQEMRYSEDNEVQESEDERNESQDNELESEDERVEAQHNENEESDEGRRYSSQITVEEESDDENVDSQNSARSVSKQRYFLNNSTRDESTNYSEESNREDTLTRRQNIIDILQKVKQQNLEMSRQAEQAVRNSLKRPPTESWDVFKVPVRPKAGLRRLKPLVSKPKPKTVKSTHVVVENLPPEVLEDLKYKPPKRYRPSNASWITKRLYKFLETKLEPKYDYKARVRAEKLAEALYEFAKETRRRNVADSNAVDSLKNEMARLGIVSTHFEFYQFFHDFMPREIRIKVVPDIVNKISMPKHGIFSNIIR